MPLVGSQRSPRGTFSTSSTDPPELVTDDSFEAGRLVEVGVQLFGQAFDAVGQWLGVRVLVGFGCADIPARRENVVLAGDLVELRRVAEAGHVLVRLALGLRGFGAAPGVVRVGD